MDTLGTQTTCLVGGTVLHWAEMGAGRPLVLLHGLSDSLWTWRRVARQLSSTHRVLMLDLAGHGLSGRPDASYDLDWHASLVGSWIDSLGLDQIDLVGHSFGGGIAQCLLLSHHHRVRRLGLVASGGFGREVSLGLKLLSLPGAEEVIRPFLGLGTRMGMKWFGDVFSAEDRLRQGWFNSRPGTARALTRSVRGVINLGGQRRHFLDQAHELSRLPPLAVFWGGRDEVLPAAHATRMMSQIHNVRVKMFPGCGHFPHLERPGQFIGALNSFLEDRAAEGARIVVPARPRRRWWFGRALDSVAGWLRRLLRRIRGKRPPRTPLLPACTSTTVAPS